MNRALAYIGVALRWAADIMGRSAAIIYLMVSYTAVTALVSSAAAVALAVVLAGDLVGAVAGSMARYCLASGNCEFRALYAGLGLGIHLALSVLVLALRLLFPPRLERTAPPERRLLAVLMASHYLSLPMGAREPFRYLFRAIPEDVTFDEVVEALTDTEADEGGEPAHGWPTYG